MENSQSIDSYHHIAHQFFQIKVFRKSQAECIEHILSNRDVLAVFPTGYGKSVVYQIAGMLFPHLTLVVEPLVSLILDQVRILRDIRGFESVDYLCSGRDPNETEAVFGKLPSLRFLYVTPERLNNKIFLERLKTSGVQISQIVIDEAHCVSLWGKSFRPSYLTIARFCKNFPHVVITAFSATASKRVAADIVSLLKMRTPKLFTESIRRENIRIGVAFVSDKTEYLLSHLSRTEKTIVYCSSRYQCDKLGYLLNAAGYRATVYHAGMSFEEKGASQQVFIDGSRNIMIATSAFGMGIDIADIRRVVHADLPYDLDGYVQEMGRAGRDGKVAQAVILWEKDDFQNARKRLDKEYPDWNSWLRQTQDAQKYGQTIMEAPRHSDKKGIRLMKREYLEKRRLAKERLDSVIRFVGSADCRYRELERYFNQDSVPCGLCDRCQSHQNSQELNDTERTLLWAIRQLGSELSENELRRVVFGVSLSSFFLPAYGILRGKIGYFNDAVLGLLNRGYIRPHPTGENTLVLNNLKQYRVLK